MLGCLVLAFQLCNPNYGAYSGSYAYAQSGYVVQQPVYVQPQPVVVYPAPVIYAQPVYAQPYYGGGYPFAGGGIGVRVGPRGGVSVRCC